MTAVNSSSSPLLEIEDLRVAFPNRDGGWFEAVRGVSFSLGRERLGIVGEMHPTPLHRVIEGGGCEGCIRPASGTELALRARDIEIGEADDMDAAHRPRLCGKHRAELAGADQADRHRPAGRLTFQKLGMEIQLRARLAPASSRRPQAS